MKRILLLGEYSGFFSNLKEGFEKIGYEVVLYHDGDGGKKIGGNHEIIDLKPKSIINNFRYLHNLSEKLAGFDAVFFINPNLLGPYYSLYFFKLIRKKNRKVYVSSCGDSTYLLKAVQKGKFRYYMFNEDLNGSYRKIRTVYERPFMKYLMHYIDWYVFSNVNSIIPTSYEYAFPLEEFDNVTKGIGLPIVVPDDCPNIEIKEKILIYYGKNKPFFKGASYIEPALQRLQNEYPDELEVIINERIPYEIYQKVIDDADIIIDQCKSYGWGMNALIAMAKGKVVASGCEPETLDYFGLTECPIINIIPDQEQIYQSLKKVVLNRDELKIRKRLSYEFVKRNNDALRIAYEYSRLFEE